MWPLKKYIGKWNTLIVNKREKFLNIKFIKLV